MRTSTFPRHQPIRRLLNPFVPRGLPALVVFLALAAPAFATVSVSGTLSPISLGSTNDYSLTLQNTSTGGESISTFWFAWIPGQDYLPSTPLSVQLPAGWTDTITGGSPGDGHAIRFSTSTAPIPPGSSLSGFGFTTTDTLSQLQGNSPFYPGTRTTTSEASTGAGFSGLATGPFVVTVVTVPEPPSAGLLGLGCAIFVLWRLLRRFRSRPTRLAPL